MTDDAFFNIPVEIKNALDKRIKKAFRVYDHGNNLMIESPDVGSILRALGCAPSEAEIEKIIKATEFEECEGKIHLSRFLPHVKELLYAKKMMPASSREILDAFKVLDPKGRGYLKKIELMTYLKDFGEKISEEEVNEMINSAVDVATNQMQYETYSVQLTYEPSDEDDIFKLAEEIYEKEKAEKLKKKKK